MHPVHSYHWSHVLICRGNILKHILSHLLDIFTMASTLVGPWSWRHPVRLLVTISRKDKNKHVCSRAVQKYIRPLGSCDISDINDNSDSRQEQTYLQDSLYQQ